MLGEKLGGETGKVTSQRVLANPGGAPKMETSFQATGRSSGQARPTSARTGRSFARTVRCTEKDKAL